MDSVLINYGDNYFIKSKNIDVFPCSYRGTYTDASNVTKIFNTEARLNTEKNLISPTGRLEINSRKSGYIISTTELLNSDTNNDTKKYNIELNIGGYYFKLKEVAINDLIKEVTISGSTKKEWVPLTLHVKLIEKTLSGTADEETKLLNSWTNEDLNLDILYSGTYIFTGLLFSTEKSEEGADYTLELVVKSGDNWIFNPRLFLPNIISNSDNSGGIEIPEGTVTIGNPEAPGATKTFELNEENATIYVPLTVNKTLTVSGTNTLIIGQDPAHGNGLRFSADNGVGNNINTTTRFDTNVSISTFYAGFADKTNVPDYRIFSNKDSTIIYKGIIINGGATIKDGKFEAKYNENNKININNSGTKITGNAEISGTLTANNTIVNTSLVLYDENSYITTPTITALNSARIGSLEKGIFLSSDGGINIANGSSSRKPFSVDYDGNVTALSYTATSDKRLKENIIEYVPEKSILDLPIYKYDFIDGSKNQIGCLAQELQEICPEIVKENQDGYLSIQESKIVYLLLDEVKKLKAEIEKLKIKED